MANETSNPLQSISVLPPDDPMRAVAVANPDDPNLPHVCLGGDTYTILVTGEQSGGRYSLIDMYVPAGAGPPPHRHNFDESFTLLEGEVEFTVRGQTHRVIAGSTITVPSNAPHFFQNKSGKAARMLCVCVPSGLDEFFITLGVAVNSRTATAPQPTKAEMEARMQRARPLAAKCGMEMIAP